MKRLHSTTTRVLVLLVILAVAATGYVRLLVAAPSQDFPQERRLAGFGGTRPAMHVYLELIAVDAAREEMQVRVSASLEPDGPLADADARPNRDLTLVLGYDRQAERIGWPAHRPLPATTIELDLQDGTIAAYPLDAYQAALRVLATEASVSADPPSAPTSPLLIPIDVTVWERALGFRLRTRALPDGPPQEARLGFEIRRTRALEVFVIAGYAAMAVLAFGALAVGTLTFLGVRRIEAALLGALGAIVFALPVLRNALPGGAPLGVRADILVFVWAQMIAVFALALLVVAWARRGPCP